VVHDAVAVVGRGGETSTHGEDVSASPAGYSVTPLWKKLGVRVGGTIVALNAPRNYRKLLVGLPRGVAIVAAAEDSVEFVHLFTDSAAELAKRLAALRDSIAPDGVIWVSWPKKASGVKTDITEDTIRDVALPLGLVDVKVCAVDAIWSGLKLVIRKSNRTRKQ
jgi:hypothetical protein